jgi:Tfp pilus assembly protein PilV
MLSKKMQGFSIIEILVTLGVLTVGILGVATLNSVVTQQSFENKASTEALQIAESRIEEMRNYTGSITSETAFNTRYANITDGNSVSVTGTSTFFTRTETIVTSGNIKAIAVKVAWTDGDGEAQSVSVNTQLSYLAPRSVGDSALSSAEPLVDAPTGRARLGDGTVPASATDSQLTNNNDGTTLYNDGGADLKLTVGSQIVLTLTDACQLSGGGTLSCTGFVKIKGKIYIDTATQTQLDPGEVFVVASDAAYCTRYYTVSGAATAITNSTVTANATATGNYKYFDYTCYLGGGWHGNIGVLLAGGNTEQDKFCMGDPTSSLTSEDPIIAARRVYRGMLHKFKTVSAGGMYYYNDAGQQLQIEHTSTSSSTPRFYSQGIADATVLPVPESAQKTHDFVIGKLNANLTAGTNCGGPTTSLNPSIMTRTDATISGVSGKLFDDMPVDFICLNTYLDSYDDGEYGHDSSCPYNPSDPPSTRHLISGVLQLTTTQTSANAALATAMKTITSDGSNNCRITTTAAWNTSYYQSAYECDVYDWGAGWNGYLQVQFDASSVSCTTSRINYSVVTADDSTGNDFISCSTGSYAVYSGNVTQTGSRKLTGATMSNGGTCTVPTAGVSYQCLSPLLNSGATWSGSLTFTISSGVMCGGTSYAYSVQTGGSYTKNLKIAPNTSGCP